MSASDRFSGAAHSNLKRTSQRFGRSLLAPHCVAGVLAFLLYSLCVAPTVTYGGDCGELIAASWRLGIAHPTGYTFYCLAAKCFALLLPFGEIGWRYNLFSAFCGALAVGLIAATISRLVSQTAEYEAADAEHETQSTVEIDRTLRATQTRATHNWVAATGGALVLAGFFYFWSQCVLAEVYATGALLLASLLLCAVSWRSTGDWRWLYSLAAVFGLALNAHLSCVYFAPGLAIYCLWPERARLRTAWPRTASILLLLFFAGYSIAVYLPLRSATFPAPVGQNWAPLDWTHPVDGASFWAHATARQYRVWLLTQQTISLGGQEFSVPAWVQSPAVTRARLASFASLFAVQLLWCFPLVLVGIWFTWKRERALFALLALTATLNIGVQIHYTVGDVSNFFFPAYLSMAVWLGLGIFAASGRWGARTLGALVGAAFIVQVGMFSGLASQRGETRARDDALARAATLESLGARNPLGARGKASVFILSDDALWAFWYAKFVLYRAPQTATPWGPARTRSLRSGNLWQLVAAAKKTGPVALTQFDEGTDARFPLVPATSKGDLWLASSRELPLPAQASTVEFDRTRAVWRAARRKGDVPQLKRSDVAALDVTFRAPKTAAPNVTAPLRISRREGAMHSGWIEVLLAAKDEVKNPPPTQRAIRRESVWMPPLVAWREDRRLILPLDANSHNGIFRATLAINMHKDARLGPHDFWTRIVRSRNDTTTPWQRGGIIQLTGE